MNTRFDRNDILEDETIDIYELFRSVLKYFKLIVRVVL